MNELETLIEYHRYVAGGDIPLTDKVKELLNGNTGEGNDEKSILYSRFNSTS